MEIKTYFWQFDKITYILPHRLSQTDSETKFLGAENESSEAEDRGRWGANVLKHVFFVNDVSDEQAIVLMPDSFVNLPFSL